MAGLRGTSREAKPPRLRAYRLSVPDPRSGRAASLWHALAPTFYNEILRAAIEHTLALARKCRATLGLGGTDLSPTNPRS